MIASLELILEAVSPATVVVVSAIFKTISLLLRSADGLLSEQYPPELHHLPLGLVLEASIRLRVGPDEAREEVQCAIVGALQRFKRANEPEELAGA